MLRPLAGVVALLLVVDAPAQIKPTPGLVITKSGSIRRGTYLLPSTEGAAITVQGDNLTVDFKGATLRGTPEDTLPDQRQGTGIRVIGSNVTIKNAKVRGYKVGLIARDAPGIKILDSDFSYNWKQHLKSTLERENEDDWMSYHHNEQDEWLRYGAGIYLSGCDGFEVRHCTVTGGQCALMLVKSSKGLAWNNDFSFNSGIGIGLYRSSDNRIMHNAMDWCVRGYSQGYYNRGQDSAGILVYEQSNRNLIAYNSATHSGDGFFLWAGQSTMDTGVGGCNDNVVYGNDFSHAPANGIEATFSRNTFANNYLRECNYGVWGGYSFNSVIVGNWIFDDGVGVAIEHGQDNAIRGNYFRLPPRAIRLWQNSTQDPDWGYPKHHDTKSRDYKIEGNFISRADAAFDLTDTTGVSITGNQVQLVDTLVKRQGNTQGLVVAGNKIAGPVDPAFATGNTFGQEIEVGFFPEWDPYARGKSYPQELQTMRPERLKDGMSPFLPEGALRGRYNILVDEWGPYDYRFPRVWPEPPGRQSAEAAGRVPEKARDLVQTFRVVGPPGKWRVKNPKGVENVHALEGDVPGQIEVTLPSGKAGDINLQLEYIGDHDTFDFLGRRHKAGETIPFGYQRFVAPIAWSLKLFAWDETTDPRTKPDAFAKLIAGTPVLSADLEELRFGTSGPFNPKAPKDHFATVSKGTVDLPEGAFRLEVTSDDGCRVWVDGKKVIDEWHYQGPTTYTAPLTSGKHEIRIDHFEIDGYAALAAEIKRA